MSINELVKEFSSNQKKKLSICIIIFILLILSILICTSIGVTDSSVLKVIKTIGKGIRAMELDKDEKIIYNLRLPRTLLGLVAGLGLGISGTVMQGITRNPLVSPFTIGVSSAAAFGASMSIVFGFGILGGTKIGTVIMAFVMALICTGLIFFIAAKVGLSDTSIVLTGIAMNYLFQAMSTSVQYMASEAKLAEVIAWTFGSINGATWSEFKISSSITLVSCVLLITQYDSLSIISIMEDDISQTMGVNPKVVRIISGVLSVIITAAIISFTGVIGFVGLAAPHIGRTMIGNNNRYLIPASGMLGAILIIVGDTIGRTILSPIVIPVGIVISFIGVPLFVHQVVLNNRK